MVAPGANRTTPLGERLTKLLAGICLGLFLLAGLALFLAATSHQVITPPDNAIVYANDATRRYMTPPCSEAMPAGWRRTTHLEVKRLDYNPDYDCLNRGGLGQTGRSIPGALLEKAGLLKPLQRRWNDDGSWNY